MISTVRPALSPTLTDYSFKEIRHGYACCRTRAGATTRRGRGRRNVWRKWSARLQAGGFGANAATDSTRGRGAMGPRHYRAVDSGGLSIGGDLNKQGAATMNNAEPNDSLRTEGERLRDVGMALAAARRPDRVTLGRLALVQALVDSLDGTATIDDATPPDEMAAGYEDGGRWRGTVTRSLVADGLATIDGTTRSRRPSRHRGYVARLRLADRPAAIAYLQRMAAALAAYDATPPAGTGGVAHSNSTSTTTA